MAKKTELKVKVVSYPNTSVLVTEALLRLYELHKDKLELDNKNR
ncbi:MAG: hypothetical protein E6940_10640 [Clostridium septicum]|nr:hypothetical protein [Clostridium septicum]MDU1314501.1 hypothetical protein [Clostridium septicum]